MSDNVAGLLAVLVSALVWATVKILTERNGSQRQDGTDPERRHEVAEQDNEHASS